MRSNLSIGLSGVGLLAVAVAASAVAHSEAAGPSGAAGMPGSEARLYQEASLAPAAQPATIQRWAVVRAGSRQSLEPTAFGAFPEGAGDWVLISGDLGATARAANGVVITHTLAMRLFGDTEAIGQEVAVNGMGSFVVGAVIDEPPSDFVPALYGGAGTKPGQACPQTEAKAREAANGARG